MCDIGKGVTRALTLPGGGSVVGALAPVFTAGLSPGGAFAPQGSGYSPAIGGSMQYMQTAPGAYSPEFSSVKRDNTGTIIAVSAGALLLIGAAAFAFRSRRAD